MARVSRFEDSRDEILTSIQSAAIAHGKPPSVRNLAEKLEVGVATMHSYLQLLADEELIEWHKGRHRTLHITSKGMQALS